MQMLNETALTCPKLVASQQAALASQWATRISSFRLALGPNEPLGETCTRCSCRGSIISSDLPCAHVLATYIYIYIFKALKKVNKVKSYCYKTGLYLREIAQALVPTFLLGKCQALVLQQNKLNR